MLGSLTAEELNVVFRQDVVDIREGVDADNPDSENLWKDVEVYRYMTVAVDRFCKDVGYSTMRIITRAVEVDNPRIPIPASVLEIRHARLLTARRDLKPANLNEGTLSRADDYGMNTIGYSDMLTATGTPLHYIRDYYGDGDLRLVPIPAATDVLELQCTTTLACKFVDGTEPLLVTDIEDQQIVLMYMKYQAYNKQDADAAETARAIGFKREYDAAVKVRKSQLKNQRRRPGVVRYCG